MEGVARSRHRVQIEHGDAENGRSLSRRAAQLGVVDGVLAAGFSGTTSGVDWARKCRIGEDLGCGKPLCGTTPYTPRRRAWCRGGGWGLFHPGFR